MWPDLISKAKSDGLNSIETYVFWNDCEQSPGNFSFEKLGQFLQECAKQQMYVILRIGPYVCAEWNYGGFPIWLREIPGIVFRTDNEPYKAAMARFVTAVVNNFRSLFADKGGPIILAQIENEYSSLEWEYGDAGKRYARWCADLALSYKLAIPWIMCQQDEFSDLIMTCNGWYCDNWISAHVKAFPNQPSLWTEAWDGWFQDWGEARPTRPPEDLAFAVARWFARGGSGYNLYMFHGGTNWGRTAGGPFIITSYDYNAPLTEIGRPNEPKYTHLAHLHGLLTRYADALLGNPIPVAESLGSNLEAHRYGTGAGSIVFLSNINSGSGVANVTYDGRSYLLPPWSVTIVVDGSTVAFNTATLPPPTPPGPAGSGPHVTWTWAPEPVGALQVPDVRVTYAQSPLEQLSFTHDLSDYLWYSTNFSGFSASGPHLFLVNANDYVRVFLDGQHIGGVRGSVLSDLKLPDIGPGTHTLDLLSMTVGLTNGGAHQEAYVRGLTGSVTINLNDLTKAGWSHVAGLLGERYQVYTPAGAARFAWNASLTVPRPMTWYSGSFFMGTIPTASGFGIDLSAMGKGFVWLNGHPIGRYWNIIGDQSLCSTCDYRGTYTSEKCRVDCGRPSQTVYALAREFLNVGTNIVTIFEESGGDVYKVAGIVWF